MVQGTALRKALGLRSACFTVVWQSGTFSFTTKGYGHGVGMSQWGAKALAEQTVQQMETTVETAAETTVSWFAQLFG